VLKAESAEREREEEEEEMEVLGAVAADLGSESESESESDDDIVMDDKHYEQDEIEGENNGRIEGIVTEEEEEESERETSEKLQKSVWRKSLERIWPFRSSSPIPNDIEEDETVCPSCLPGLRFR